MKRIIFVTTDYSYFTLPISQPLCQFGFKVKVFDYYRPNFITRLTGWLSNRGFLPQILPLRLINLSLLQQVHSFRPHYLLVIKGDTLTSQTISQISNSGVVTINWFPDWLISWQWVKTYAPLYTVFINSCYDTFEKLTQLGIKNYYLPYAAPTSRHRKKLIKKYAVTFIGQHSPRRERYFKYIADLGLQIWGYDRWRTSSLTHLFNGATSQAETQTIISRSRIVINILTGTDSFQPTAVNVRTFEALSAGTFLLVRDHPILKRHFKVGKELVTFTTPNDLRHKVKYYLTHSQEREKIALAGYNGVLKNHTFAKRLQELFKIVDQHVAST